MFSLLAWYYPLFWQTFQVTSCCPKKKDMFGLFKKDPVEKLAKEINLKLEKARDVQRSGDIKAYALLMGEIDEMQQRLDTLRSST